MEVAKVGAGEKIWGGLAGGSIGGKAIVVLTRNARQHE